MRFALIGVVISIALGMALTGELVFERTEQVRFQDNPDSLASVEACAPASLGTMLSWWARPWLPEKYLFYRPLYTALMWAEAKLWGYNFFPYTVVSWVLQGLNSGLIFLLVFSLCGGPRWQRLVAGLGGALMLSLGHDAAGAWGPAVRVAWAIMPFWPAQTDIASLTCGLLSLVCLDRHLVREQRRQGDPELPRDQRLFVAACAAFLGALQFKETALAVLAIAVGLALYRRVNWRQTALWFGVMAAAFLTARALVLPDASNPQWLGWRTLSLWTQYSHLLTGELLTQREIWEFVTIVTLVPLVILLWRKRVSITYIILACLVWPFLWAGVLTGNPALATIKREMTILARFAGVYGGLALALLYARREPLLPLIVGLVVLAAANVERFGPHYWYWTVALWALIDGVALNAVANRIREWREVQRTAAAHPTEAVGGTL